MSEYKSRHTGWTIDDAVGKAERLPSNLGSAGQVLKSTGMGMEWGDASPSASVDPTLSIFGAAADAAKTGEALLFLNKKIDVTTDGCVTPEQFGAVGDGDHDDAPAFSAAFKTGKRVVCAAGKTYTFLTDVICDEVEWFRLDGGNATFKNFYARFNMKQSGSVWTWRSEYPAPLSVVEHCIFMGRKPGKPLFYSGTPILMRSCSARDVGTLIARPNVYMDYTRMENVTIYRPNVSEYAVCRWDGTGDWTGTGVIRGDEISFYNVHVAYGDTNTDAMIMCQCNGTSLIHDHCMNIGFHGYTGSITARDCYLERTRVLGNSDISQYGTRIRFVNTTFSHFVDFSKFENIPMTFENCIFRTASHTSFNGIPARFYDSGNALKNCRIQMSDTTDITKATSYVKYAPRAESVLNWVGRLSNNAVTVLMSAAQTAGGQSALVAGDYTYYVCPTVYYNKIGGVVFKDYTATLTLSDGDCVKLNLKHDASTNNISDCILIVYRKNPDGSWYVSRVPHGHGNVLVDNGRCCCGFDWVETSEPVITVPAAGYAMVKATFAVGTTNIVAEDVISVNRITGGVAYGKWS